MVLLWMNKTRKNLFISAMIIKKLTYVFLGILSLLAGFLGIIIPGIPATPFLLLTAYLFMKGSPRLHHMLMENRWAGPFIKDFQQKRGMTVRIKIYAISMVWIMVGISAGIIIESEILKILILLSGLTGTLVMGFVIRTVKDEKENNH